VDGAGNIYIADTFNQRIRLVLAKGVIETIAGAGGQGYTGDGGPALKAGMNFPAALAVDSNGNVYVCDSQNNVVRELAPSGALSSPGTPSITSIQNASGYGGGLTTAQGSWIEIKGTNLAADTRAWGGTDFVNGFAPTALDRTSVTVGGLAAYIFYVSPTQVNALLPLSPALNGPEPVIVRNAAGVSSSANINVVANEPGFYAPGQLLIGGKQYAGAVFLDNKTFVAPVGAASGGLVTRPAKAGDTITLYGIGFGGVFPGVTDGQIVQFPNNLLTTITISIGNAQVMNYEYAGLAPESIGLYQFTFDVPQGVTPGALVPLVVSQGGVPISQTLYTAISN
ncbi:MAG TPA: IPT/TIG domain-containing protein, partial [Bryobacteraceae bacterium]|nr:IPT/TIG domain-containing protein [Bryobacteraceae bacterium]